MPKESFEINFERKRFKDVKKVTKNLKQTSMRKKPIVWQPDGALCFLFKTRHLAVKIPIKK